MSIKITISIDSKTKQSLSSLARKRRRTASGLISDLINRESKKEKITIPVKGFGFLLRPQQQALKKDAGKNYKELLGAMLEKKYNSKQ